MDSSSFVTSGPVCNALSVPCLIFMAEQKKKRNNFSMVTKIGVNGPSLGHWRPLNPTGKKGPWAVFFATQPAFDIFFLTTCNSSLQQEIQMHSKTHGFVPGPERLGKVCPGAKQVEKVQSGNWTPAQMIGMIGKAMWRSRYDKQKSLCTVKSDHPISRNFCAMLITSLFASREKIATARSAAHGELMTFLHQCPCAPCLPSCQGTL